MDTHQLPQPTRDAKAPRACVDCGAPVVRALRCRRCRERLRYASDPDYRARNNAASLRYQQNHPEKLANRSGLPVLRVSVWMAAAILAGAKTVMRVSWPPAVAVKFHVGQPVPLFVGSRLRPTAIVRLTAEPRYE